MSPTPSAPQRSWGQALGDTALETGAGVVGMARGVAGLGDFVQTAISTRPPTAHPKMDALADIEAGILNQRSDNAKYIDAAGGPSFTREPGRYAAHVMTGVAPYVPLALLGPIGGAATAAGIAFGNEQAQDREAARSGDMSQNSQYLSLIQSGLTDEEARERLFQINSDPSNPDTYLRRAPAVIGQAAGFGAGVAFTKGLTRKISDELTDKIMAATTGGGARRAALIGAGTGAGTGAMMGAGTDYSRQASEVQMGLRDRVDYGEVGGATVEPAALFGLLGGAGHGMRRLRELAAKRRGETPAPPIGTDTLAVAKEEAVTDQPLPPDRFDDATRPPTPDEQYDIRPVDRPTSPEEQYDIQPTTRPTDPYEQYDVPLTDRPPGPYEQYDRLPPYEQSDQLREPPLPEPAEPWAPEQVPAPPLEEPWQPGTRPVEDVTGGPAPSAPAVGGSMETGMLEKGLDRASSKEEARPGAGPAPEAVARPKRQAQARRQEEAGEPQAVAEAEGGSTPAAVPAEPPEVNRDKSNIKSSEPVPATENKPAPGAKGKAVLATIRERNAKVAEKLADTSLGARLDPTQRIAAEKLKEKLAAKPETPTHELVKESLAEAHVDPRNYVARVTGELQAQEERKTAADTASKRRRRAEAAGVREKVLEEALSTPSKSEGHVATGADRSAREVYASRVNDRRLATFKGATPEEVHETALAVFKKAEERIKTAINAMRIAAGKGAVSDSRVKLELPRSRAKNWENNPWYSGLYDMERLKNYLGKLMTPVSQRSADERLGWQDLAVRSRTAQDPLPTIRRNKGLIGDAMTQLYILDEAMAQKKIHLWDRYTKERATSEYTELQRRRRKLELEVQRLQEAADTVAEIEGRTAGSAAKLILSDEERARYVAAQRMANPQRLKERSNELVKHNRKIAEAHESSGLDLYSQNEAINADFEDHLIKTLDMREAEAFDFINRHLRQEEAELIQRAREEKRLDTIERKTGAPRPANDAFQPIQRPKGERYKVSLRDVAKPTETAPSPSRAKLPDEWQRSRPLQWERPSAVRARETHASKRTLEIVDEADRIMAAVKDLPDENEGNVAKVVDTLHAALGDKSLSRARTEKNAQFLRDYAYERMRELETEQRGLAEDINPFLLNDDYSVGRVLDPAADLKAKRNLPAGAYVRHVSDFLKPGRTLSGLDTSIRSADALQNHVFDVANKIVGDMEVVGLTAEQMRLAAEHRQLPADTPAFYDPKAGRIFVSHDVGRPGSEAYRRVLGHEIVHPLSEVALENFPEIGARIEAVRKQLEAEVMKGDTAAAKIMDGRMQGLLNTHEFLSEFFNDGGLLQSALDTIPAGKRPSSGGFASALGRVKAAIGRALFRLFLRTNHKTALSDAMVHSLDLFRETKRAFEGGSLKEVTGTTARPMAVDWNAEAPAEKAYDRTANWLKDRMAYAQHVWSRMDGKTGVALWGHDLAQQARRAEPAMQEKTEAIRKALAHSFGSAKRIMDDSGAYRIAEDIADVMRRNPTAWDKFEDYMDRENQAAVSGSDAIGKGMNDWVSATSREHAQYRAEHAKLAADYAQMPVPMKQLRDKLRAFYDKRHDEIANAQISQIIDLRHMAPDAATNQLLTKYIRDKKTITPAERAELEAKVPGFSFDLDNSNKTAAYKKFREGVRGIHETPHLRKLPGVWYPKMRKGDWVVEGYFDTAKHAEPLGGVEVEGTRGAWDFPTEAARDKFMDAMAADPTLSKIKFSGMSELIDDDGKSWWRARYNPILLEFHKSQFDAAQQMADLRRQFSEDDFKLAHVQPKKAEEGNYLPAPKGKRVVDAMLRSLKRSEGWADLDATTKRKLERELEEGAVRHIMSVSARANYLPRTYALGARKDIMQDFLDYSTNTSYSLAEVRHRGETARAYKAMDDYVDSMKFAGSPGDPQGKFGILRQQLQQSLHRRADFKPDPIFGPWWKKGLSRVLQLSYLDKLVSPMNWVLNATELMMTGVPMLGGEHGGYLKALGAVSRAYNDVGLGQFMEGFKDAATVYRAGAGNVPQLPDNPQRFKEATKHLPDAANIHKMIDYLEEYAHLDRDSSMEVGRIFDPTAGRLMRNVDWADNITRQVSANIDNTNRVVLGIAAMRLALQKGMTMEQALAHAEKYVHKTVGNYAKYNEAEMFRHPALGAAMQFKRYAQRQTANWVAAVYQSFARDVPPEQKAVARRQLMYMSGTVLAVSGALGLPLEPIKGVINAFSPLTGFNSEDAEDRTRQWAAELMGPDAGAIFTRGIPRYFNMGIGTRLGLDSLWTYGAPGTKTENVWASLGHLIGGAPVGYAVDAVSGLMRITDAAGNFARGEDNEGWNNLRHGAQLALPIKVASDVISATANYMGGPTTRTRYGQPLGYQPTLGETAMEMAGLRSGRSQEMADLRRAISTDRTRIAEQRNQLYAMYAHAGSAAEKRAIFEGAKESFNKRWPAEFALTVGDFLKAEQRLKKQEREMAAHPEHGGLTLTRREQTLATRHNAYLP